MESLEILMEIIFHRYLTQTYCFTIISESNINLNYISTNVASIRLEYPKLEYILAANDMGCSDYIIQMSEPETFMKTYEEVNHLSNNRRGDRKLIFLPINDNTESLLSLLKLKEFSYIPNVLLIQPKKDEHCDEYDMVTHKFVGKNSDVKNPLYLDRWSSCSGDFELFANLFPHNMRNLQGKTIKVACFNYTPFVLLDIEDKKLAPNGRDGLDIKTVEEFCRWVNCTIEILLEDKYEWGEVYANGTGIGTLGDVAADKADLGITSMGAWYKPYIVLDFSMYCFRAFATCITPAPRMMSRWELPLLAFSPLMWWVTLLALCCAFLALTLAQRSSRKAWLITVAIIFAQPQNQTVGDKWRARSVTCWLIGCGLVINSAYSGGLAATFTVPAYERPIDTVQDLLDSGMEWGAMHNAWIYSLLPSKEPKIKQLVKRFRSYPFEVLKAKSLNRSIALGIEVLPAGYSAIGEYVTERAARDYQVMLEDFYYEYGVVVGRKNSALIGRVSELIGRLHETGLLLAWDTQMALKYLDYKVQLAVKFSRVKNPPVVGALGPTSVVGIFIIYGVGALLSIIVFLGEVYRERKNKTNKI